jgi:hypothetical protein
LKYYSSLEFMLRRGAFLRAAGTAAPCLSRAFLRAHRDTLRAEHAKVKETLALLDTKHDRIEQQVIKHLDHWAVGGLLFLVAQTGLLFHWVYFRFDWNLVEPITYLLGYSVVWLSIACFFKSGEEFTYDSIRAMVAERKRARLWSSLGGGHTLQSYVLLRNTEAELRRKIAELDTPSL